MRAVASKPLLITARARRPEIGCEHASAWAANDRADDAVVRPSDSCDLPGQSRGPASPAGADRTPGTAGNCCGNSSPKPAVAFTGGAARDSNRFAIFPVCEHAAQPAFLGRDLKVDARDLAVHIEMHTPDEALKQFPLVKLKCELVSTDGRHVRYVPGPLAQAMVDSSAAAIHNENGKVKAIRLTQPPSSYAQ